MIQLSKMLANPSSSDKSSGSEEKKKGRPPGVPTAWKGKQPKADARNEPISQEQLEEQRAYDGVKAADLSRLIGRLKSKSTSSSKIWSGSGSESKGKAKAKVVESESESEEPKRKSMAKVVKSESESEESIVGFGSDVT